MPEKTANKVAANGAVPPVPEKAPEKIAETARHYLQEAEKVGGEAFRSYNDFLTTTADYYFDTLDNTIHANMEVTMRAEKAMEDMITIYRRVYDDGMESWKTYLQDVNKTFSRPK